MFPWSSLLPWNWNLCGGDCGGQPWDLPIQDLTALIDGLIAQFPQAGPPPLQHISTSTSQQPQRGQIATGAPSGPVCVSAGQIDAVLAGTPLAGQGQNFYDAGQQYGVNPALPVAIAGAESTFGENVNTTWGLHNAWGWGSTQPFRSIAQSWTTWKQGIDMVTAQLAAKRYLGGGMITTAQIYGEWCSGDCAGGLRTIDNVLTKDFGVSPSSLGFKACSEGQP